VKARVCDLEVGFDCPYIKVDSSKRSDNARAFLIFHLNSRNTQRLTLELTRAEHEAFNIIGESGDKGDAIAGSG
jgi:hypothetical protein